MRVDLASLQRQLEPLINERRVTELDLMATQTLALIDIAESLRILCTNTAQKDHLH